MVVLTARFPARRETGPGWSGTQVSFPAYLTGARVRNVLTGVMIRVDENGITAEEIFGGLPVAVFRRE